MEYLYIWVGTEVIFLAYGKLVREKVIEEIIDLDEKHKHIQSLKTMLDDYEEMTDTEKLKQWKECFPDALREEIKSCEEEFAELLEEMEQ